MDLPGTFEVGGARGAVPLPKIDVNCLSGVGCDIRKGKDLRIYPAYV